MRPERRRAARSFAMAGVAACALACSALAPANPPRVDAAGVTRAIDAIGRAMSNDRYVRLDVTLSTRMRLDPDSGSSLERRLVAMWGERHVAVARPDMSMGWAVADGRLYAFDFAKREAETSVSKDAVPAAEMYLPLLLQLDVPLTLGTPARQSHTSLCETVRRSKALGVEGDDSCTTLRIEPVGSPPGTVCSFTVTTGDHPHVTASSWEAPPTAAGAPGRTERWTVKEWMQVDGLELPRAVIRESSDHGDPALDTITEVRVQAAEAIDRASTPPPILPVGFVVIDRAASLAFTVGGRDLTYRGQRYRLAAPLDAHPGERLASLIETADISLDGP